MSSSTYRCRAIKSVDIFQDQFYTHGVIAGFTYIVGNDHPIDRQPGYYDYDKFPTIKAENGFMILVINKYDYFNFKTFRESPEFAENFEWLEDLPEPEPDPEPEPEPDDTDNNDSTNEEVA